jgi:acyl-CoA synthetase (AMP-forming)/AMP-acid ligase II
MTTDTYIDIIAHLDAMTFEQRPAPEWHFPADDARLSLSTLRRRSRRYAQILRRQGVAAGDRVALVLQTGPDYVALLLAIWRLNAIAVSLALKPRRPTDSIAHLQRVTRACRFKLLVHGNEWPAAADAMLAGYGCRTLDVKQFSDNTADHAPLAPASRVATDIAVLQLSSGSTGDPKAVIVTHGMIHAQLAGITPTTGTAAGSTVCSPRHPGCRSTTTWGCSSACCIRCLSPARISSRRPPTICAILRDGSR